MSSFSDYEWSSSPIENCLPQPYHTRTYKAHAMSYQFGPHTQWNAGEHPWIYFEGDTRVVTRTKKKVAITPPPAWVVADWMIAKSNGEPISEEAEAYCDAKTTNKGLLWLRDYLLQEKK